VECIPEFRNKIVLITQQRPTAHFADQDVMGVTYASIIQNLLDEDFITPLNGWWVLMLLLLTTSVVVIVFLRKRAIQALGIGVGSLLVFAFVIVALFGWAQVYVSALPIIAPSIVMVGLLFPFELARERRKLLEERATLASELHTAHEAQMGLMPTSDPLIPGFDISGVCQPAEEVGGDYFDYVWLKEDKSRLGIAIADVSGKAMKAAMTAVMTSGMVYREIGQDQAPKVILRKINRPMYFKTDRRIFTAMTFAVIDIASKGLAFSNAGQMLPLLKRNGAIEAVRVDGAHLPLGMAEDVDYGEKMVQLQQGDVVVFYTDGIPEAMNAKREMFGFERLEEIVKASASDLSAKMLAKRIVDEVAGFTGPAKQHDDMTVVVVNVL
jgi:serine phosphatase RsbU (regulator of sigma subunit)